MDDELFNERAAIFEYDAGMSRDRAEALARIECKRIAKQNQQLSEARHGQRNSDIGAKFGK